MPSQNLTLKGAGGFRTTSIVTGAEFESGAANRARGVNDAEAVQMRTVRNALLWCIAGCEITGMGRCYRGVSTGTEGVRTL